MTDTGITPEVQAQLLAAYGQLVAGGQRVTVRALRSVAGVSTRAATDWLRELRPASEDPPLPDLADALAPLWSAAVQAARARLEEAYSIERDGLIEAESEAADEADETAFRLSVAESELAVLRTQLTEATEQAEAAEAERARVEAAAQERIDQAEAERAEAAQAMHAAQVEAADARATARTLREVIDQQQKEA